jgi:hypothetical protein
MSQSIEIKWKFIQNYSIYNEYPNLEKLKGKIYLYDSEKEKNVQIGKIKIDLYNAEWKRYGHNMYHAFERKTESFRIGNTLLREESNLMYRDIYNKVGNSHNNSILVIDEVLLLEEYRGKKYGEEILNGMEQAFVGRYGYMALQSFPKQHEIFLKDRQTEKFNRYGLGNMEQNPKKAQLALNKFYEKCGFTNVHKKLNILVKNIAPFD